MVDEDGVLTIQRATNDNDWFLGFASASWAVGGSPLRGREACLAPPEPLLYDRFPRLTGRDRPGLPGAVAQLVAHLVRIEGVRGSSPLSSTLSRPARSDQLSTANSSTNRARKLGVSLTPLARAAATIASPSWGWK